MFQIIKKFQKILNAKQKMRVVIIGIMMVFGALLETLGVGLILPLVSAIMQPDIIENNELIKKIYKGLDLQSSRAFIILIIIALIFVFLFKNLYLFFQYYVQYRFVCNNRFSIQKQLMQVFLNRPYEYYLYIESGEIIRMITDDTNQTFGLLTTLLSFFTEAAICTALVITIIITDPFMAIMLAGILGLAMLLIRKVLKPILKSAGLSFQSNVVRMNKWLLQSISGIKELKIAEKEDFFLDQFSKYGKRTIDSEKINNVLGTVPRLSIEAIGVSAMLGVIAFLMLEGREVNTMLPQLSAFAMAAVRLLPSVNRMSTALNSMAYQEPFLDKMIENLTTVKQWQKKEDRTVIKKDGEKKFMMAEKIQLSNITYAYPNTETCVLSHANMEIPVGTSIGVVGTSGSGKTTAIDILLGLLLPQEGNVLVDGVDIQKDYSGWLSHIGYIPQVIYMLDDTIRANVAFGIYQEEVDEDKVWKALEEAQLAEFVAALPDKLETTIGEQGVRLSGGQKQRIGIARALYSDPELLVFDEATSSLDDDTEMAIMDSINNLHGKKTMVIIAHRLGTIKECDIVYRVEHGTIVKQ